MMRIAFTRKNISWILAICVIGTIVAGGCSSSKTPAVNVSTGKQTAGILVTGTGKISGAPDSLTLTMGVSLTRNSVNSATTAASEQANAVIGSLKASGVDDKDIQTANYSVAPEYEYDGNRQIPKGYRVSNTVTATIKDLNNAGQTIDAAVKAGGNDSTVQDVSFTLEDNTQAVEDARAAAFEDAKRKAEQFADLAGRGLGDVQYIKQADVTEPVTIPYAEAKAADSEATPIQPGEVTTKVTVSIRWAFK